jgi:tetratricopeptide (TPR) repeat protein
MNYISQRKLGISAATLAAFLFLAPLQGYALAASEIFADGNRLFRDDLYWAALLRYRQAYEAGMDTPLLHYNMGVAHYKAGQHIRARTALLKAVQDPGLRIISQYNLGLNAYAAGDVDEALNWFRQARDQEQSKEIRKLAIIAISRLQSEKREEDVLLARVEKRKVEPKFTNFDLNAFVGFGTDDNVFRAPGQDYIDFADPALPLVTPEAVSGAFVPIDVQLKYSINSLRFESFYGAYRVTGRLYQDTELENANEYSHELSFGSSYRRREDNRERRVFSAFTFAQHDETYFDPDDGTAREVGTELIDERMNYTRYGPEFVWVQAYDRFALGLRIKGQLWNYEDPDVVPEYDHEYFLFAAHAQYQFTRTSLLRLSVDKYSRRYGDRPAFDLDGNQPVTNPDLRYDYLTVGLTARQRITRTMWFGFNVELTDRQDRYLGYNDYTRDEFGVDFSWTPSPRFRLELSSYYRNYDYPNAFAFHNPVAGIKTLESLRGNVLAEFRMTPRLSLRAEAELRESVSTDIRIGYDRTWFSLGVTWQQ